jgi:hypothetical protein
MDMCTNRINGDDDDDDQSDVRNDEHDEYDSGTIVILLFKKKENICSDVGKHEC